MGSNLLMTIATTRDTQRSAKSLAKYAKNSLGFTINNSDDLKPGQQIEQCHDLYV